MSGQASVVDMLDDLFVPRVGPTSGPTGGPTSGPTGCPGPTGGKAFIEQQITLIRDSLEFALRWLGWRKWLRASGLLEWAQENDDQCFVPVVAKQSTERRRQVVKQLDEEWCQINSRVIRSNPAIVVVVVGDGDATVATTTATAATTATGYKLIPLSIVQNSISRQDVLTFVMLLLNYLHARGLRFDVVHNEPLNAHLQSIGHTFDLSRVNAIGANGAAVVDTYTFDSIVQNVNDTMIESMLRALSNCLIERNESCTIFAHEPERCTANQRLGMNECIVLPFSIRTALANYGSHRSSIDGRTNFETNATTINLFVRGGFRSSVSHFLNEYADTVVAGDLPGTNCRVLSLTRNDPDDVPLDEDVLTRLIYDHFSPLMLQRSEIRYMLNTGVVAVSLTDRALLVARLLSPRVTGDDVLGTDTRVSSLFLRAMQLKRLALYRLDYEAEPQSRPIDRSSTPANRTSRATLQTLREMNVDENSFFVANGIERTNALLSAVFDLSHMRRRNVNKIWLHRATWCDSFPALTADDGNPIMSDDRMFSLVLVPTSALFDAEIVRSSLVVRNRCNTVATDLQSGLYFRHSKYREIGVVLLPSDVTPVFDRSVRATRPADDRVTETASRSSSLSPSKYLRMCVVFDARNVHRDARWFKFFSEPIGIVVILYDIVSHLFPGEIDSVLGGTTNGGRRSGALLLDGNDTSRSYAAQSRLLLGSVLRVDPFYARSMPPAFDPSCHYLRGLSSLGPVVRRYLSSGNKLWQILRAGRTKAALVRSNSSYYCPLLASLGVCARVKGIVPLGATTVSDDTWKLYVYDSVGLGNTGLVDCDDTEVLAQGVAVPTPTTGSCYPFESDDNVSRDGTAMTAGGPAGAPRAPRAREAQRGTLIGEPGNAIRLSYPPLLALKNDTGLAREQEWLIYESTSPAAFDNLVSSFGLPIDSLTDVPVVRLIAWYVDHFDPTNAESPRLQKILSKRVYLINDTLCICESPVKFVGSSGQLSASCRIAKFRGPVAVRNFADADVRPSADSVPPCFNNGEINDIDDARVQLEKDHFYNRVFRNMYRLDRVQGGVSFRQVGSFYVLTFRCARLWFPMASLLFETRTSPDGTTCYGGAPRQIVPLVDYYVRQALLTRSSSHR